MPTYNASAPAARVSYTVPPGEYQLKVEDCEETVAKSSGNPMLKLTLRIIKSDGTDGPKFTDNLVFTQSAAWKIDAFRAACGLAVEEGETSLEAADCIGLECRAKLSVEDYTNAKGEARQRNTVEAYLFDDIGF